MEKQKEILVSATGCNMCKYEKGIVSVDYVVSKAAGDIPFDLCKEHAEDLVFSAMGGTYEVV